MRRSRNRPHWSATPGTAAIPLTLTIDASAAAAVLFGEAEADAVRGQIGDASLIAPDILPFELANVCLKKIRRHPAERGRWLAGYGQYSALRVSIRQVALEDVIVRSERHGLTAYDAAYLWLSLDAEAALVSLDRALLRAYLAITDRED